MRNKKSGRTGHDSSDILFPDFVFDRRRTEWLKLNKYDWFLWVGISVTRLGDLLDFGQVFKAFGNN